MTQDSSKLPSFAELNKQKKGVSAVSTPPPLNTLIKPGVPPPLATLVVAKPGVPPPLSTLKPKSVEVAPAPGSGGVGSPLPDFSALTQVQKKAAVVPKAKKSVLLPDLKKRLGLGGHALFYRYVRIPDPHDGDNFSGPRGGVTFLIELLNKTMLRFSFAICRRDEGFSKEEGRSEVQRRYTGADYFLVTGIPETADETTLETICFALDNYLNPIEGLEVAVNKLIPNKAQDVKAKNTLKLLHSLMRDYM